MAEIAAPLHVSQVLGEFFALAGSADAQPSVRFDISEVADRQYAVLRNGVALRDHSGTGTVIRALTTSLAEGYAPAADEICWRGAAVGWASDSVLITGSDEDAVTMFLAWLIDRGFSYVSQRVVRLSQDRHRIQGFPGPLAVGVKAARQMSVLESFRYRPSVSSGDLAFVAPDLKWAPATSELACTIAVSIRRVKGARPTIALGQTQQIIDDLCGGLSAERAPRGREAARSFLAERHCLEIVFDELEQMADVVDRFLGYIIEDNLPKGAVERLISSIRPPTMKALPQAHPVMPRSTRKFDRALTIGMATYDDFDGVYFSIQSMRMYHPEILDNVEFVVIDNHPDGAAGPALHALEQKIPNYRYIPSSDRVGTAIRDEIFAEAGGRYVLSMDCHVLFDAGALKALLQYFRQHPETNDLIQGPILWDELNKFSTHWDPQWRRGMYGTWARNDQAAKPDAPPFEIPLMGLGVFACRRAAWPGFNPAFSGFGGEEGYIHEKFRQRGGRVLCLPALRWLHRFQRPLGVPYPINWPDRVHNYIVGRRELGLPFDDVVSHMREHLGTRFTNGILKDLGDRGILPADSSAPAKA